MAKSKSTRITGTKVERERSQFQYMLAKNPNYFGNIPDSKLTPIYKLHSNTSYEQLTCVGYNPDTANMEATFSVKKSVGYSSNLCGAGSFEFVRFYLDFHDGNGFIDQGSVAINVHDIPAEKDCNEKPIFPIIYVATLKKKTSKFFHCDKPILPTLRAILSWTTEPPANSPNWLPVWGNVVNCDVQLKPSFKFPILDIDLSEFLALAVDSPNLSTKQLSEITGVDLVQLNPQPLPPNLADFIKDSIKLRVPASRFAYKTVHNMIKYPASEISMLEKAILTDAKIELGQLIDQLSVVLPADTSKANVDYEELECGGNH
jgi:hypothetical protein